MAPVTEFVFSTLKPGSSIEPLYKIFETIKGLPGNQAIRASSAHEDPSQVRLHIDWDAIDSHIAFRATDAYKAYISSVTPYVAGPAKVLHAELAPFPPAVLDKSPVTEVLITYFAQGTDEAKNLAAAQSLAAKLTGAGVPGTTGLSAVGWMAEKEVEFKGEKTRALVVLLGWESVEAHQAARETDAFKQVIAGFQGAAEGLKGFEIEHVSAKAL
ncbi:hypothetical protein F4781DRAFT_53286 [Annulohypoxylon bovei var. microspora]|nr:hypothetical protein F4781DRAFT_53286 [Annulohypoxylon bovei var. microspora]